MIYLASQSPRRKELLELITPDFQVVPAYVDETVPDNITIQNTAEYLSCIKANELYNTISDGDIIIGADTIVVLDGVIFGKPVDENDAFAMLKTLSGKTHEVITGVTLLGKNKDVKKEMSFSCVTQVTFYSLTESEIVEYVKSQEPLDKAGAYGIQGLGSRFVGKINGDYFNVVGLPVSKLYHELRIF